MRDISVQLIAALPPPRVPVDLDLRLDVLDLQESLEQLEVLSANASAIPSVSPSNVARQRKEGDVLRLQRSVVRRWDAWAGTDMSASREACALFEEQVARLRVRLRLYDQFDCMKAEEA